MIVQWMVQETIVKCNDCGEKRKFIGNVTREAVQRWTRRDGWASSVDNETHLCPDCNARDSEALAKARQDTLEIAV